MDIIREALELDPTSKTWLRWKIRPRSHFRNQHGWSIFNVLYAGKEAGNLKPPRNGKQYYSVHLGDSNYLCHRIVLALSSGSDPGELQIDHRDSNGLNNNPSNLRLATNAENGWNRGRQRNNTSGKKGVDWHKKSNKWRAMVEINGRRKYLGLFDCIEAAAAAYDRVAREHFGEFYRPS